LDFRLREVTSSLQPKDHLIGQLNAQLKELEFEFERQLTEQRTVEGHLEQKDQKISHLTSEGQRLRNTIKARDRIIERFTTDLYSLVNNQKDIRLWPQEIRRMYHEHVQGDCGPTEEEQLPMEELQRQMRLMERKVSSLAVKGVRTESVCKSDIQRKGHENSMLIHELNELRVERKTSQTKMRLLELKLKETEQEVQKFQLEGKQENLALRDGSAPPLDISAASSGGPGPSRPLRRSPSAPAPGERRSQRQMDKQSVTGASSSVAGSSAAKSHGGKVAKGFASHVSQEEQRRMHNLLLTKDLDQQHIQMQKLENKILRDQVDKLLNERESGARLLSSSLDLGSTHGSTSNLRGHAAGAGRAAAVAAATARNASSNDADRTDGPSLVIGLSEPSSR